MRIFFLQDFNFATSAKSFKSKIYKKKGEEGELVEGQSNRVSKKKRSHEKFWFFYLNYCTFYSLTHRMRIERPILECMNLGSNKRSFYTRPPAIIAVFSVPCNF